MEATGIDHEAGHDGERHKENRDQLDDRLDACHHAAQQYSEGVTQEGVPQAHFAEQEQHLPSLIHVHEVVVLDDNILPNRSGPILGATEESGLLESLPRSKHHSRTGLPRSPYK